MSTFVNPRNDYFYRLIRHDYYVDKSELLSYTNSLIDNDSQFICNSRPRRFGKTITAFMISAYYCCADDGLESLSKLKIAKDPSFEKHLNKYIVVRYDIQYCISLAGSAKRLIEYLNKETIKELREVYPEILDNSITALSDALSRICNSTGKRFVFVIDEWDVLFRDYSSDILLQEDYLAFLRSIFKSIDSYNYIALAYLTGILPIKKYSTESALNNFKELTMVNPGSLAPYIGFTEDEVKLLCNENRIDFEEAKRWYDGYELKNYHIYNPTAIVNLLQEREFQSYWSNTGT
ncbi:MAG: AAA family ATPase, partial [Erysipelotrichaceae bacterium]